MKTHHTPRAAVVHRLAHLPPETRRAIAEAARRRQRPAVSIPQIVLVSEDGSRELLQWPASKRGAA